MRYDKRKAAFESAIYSGSESGVQEARNHD